MTAGDVRTEVARLISRNLAVVVEGSGLSYREIGIRCGVNDRTVVNWIVGKATPRPLSLLRACEAMGWSLDEVVGLPRTPASFPEGSTVGERLNRRIGELGVAKSEIASSVGVDRYLVDRWTRGVQVPGLAELAILCWLLGVSAEYVLTGMGGSGNELYHE